MNVYSVRLIPSLKLKLCQFLGIASTMAIEELAGRLDRLEHKIDRLDSQVRRSSRRPVVASGVAAAPAPESLKKKPSPSRRAAASKPPKAKPRLVEVTPLVRPAIAASAEVSLPAQAGEGPIVRTEPEVLPVTAAAAPRETVLLVAPEEATRLAAGQHFGPEVELVELDSVEQLPAAFAGRKVLAALFDRALLAQDSVRELLARQSREHPETRWVGLSSYLTLAFAQTMPEREEFATFLTRPLSAEALASAFEPAAEPISAAGRTDPA
ncbi:MAG: hypothetical protein U1F66_13225 [bacterium]